MQASQQASKPFDVNQSIKQRKKIQAKKAQRRNTCSDKGWKFFRMILGIKIPMQLIERMSKNPKWKGN
jgi:hypothetical protein